MRGGFGNGKRICRQATAPGNPGRQTRAGKPGPSAQPMPKRIPTAYPIRQKGQRHHSSLVRACGFIKRNSFSCNAESEGTLGKKKEIASWAANTLPRRLVTVAGDGRFRTPDPDRRVANKSQLPVERISYQSVGGWRSRHNQGPDGHVCLSLQRTDRPPGEAGRRGRRHHQAEQRLRRMWLPCSMRPVRQSAGGPIARPRLPRCRSY